MSEYQAGTPGSDGESSSLVTQAHEKVQETAQQASSTAAKAMRERIETQAVQAAAELRSVAASMRRSGHALHADGSESSAKIVDSVVDRMESLAGYLGQASGDRMLHDVESFGRRKPWAMIGAGVGLGVLASRFVKASSRERYESSIGSRAPQAPMQHSRAAGRAIAPPAPAAPVAPAPQTIGGAPVRAR
jgi:ElaB/YqjD/DUF883 family membrane-anchored ribosome-binding protein